MSNSWMNRGRRALWATALILGCGGWASADTIVYSNDPTPGDFFTSNAVAPNGDYQAIGSSGWYYANVRKDGTVGINTTYADKAGGNGSVYFNTVSSAGKADVLFATGPPLGTLADLTSLAYDWYRDALSTNSGAQAPSIRLLLGDGTSLIWEPIYNGFSDPLPVDEWVTSDAFDGGAGIFWRNNNQDFRQDLSAWQGTLGSLSVVGISSGAGSGWNGVFLGAVDKISFGFNGGSTTYNFQVVPEPSSVALGLIAGGIGLVTAARRRLAR